MCRLQSSSATVYSYILIYAIATYDNIYIYVDTRHTAMLYIRECGSTLYVGMAQGVSFSLYIGIGAKFENTKKTGERRLRTAEYRTVLTIN